MASGSVTVKALQQLPLSTTLYIVKTIGKLYCRFIGLVLQVQFKVGLPIYCACPLIFNVLYDSDMKHCMYTVFEAHAL